MFSYGNIRPMAFSNPLMKRKLSSLTLREQVLPGGNTFQRAYGFEERAAGGDGKPSFRGTCSLSRQAQCKLSEPRANTSEEGMRLTKEGVQECLSSLAEKLQRIALTLGGVHRRENPAGQVQGRVLSVRLSGYVRCFSQTTFSMKAAP